MRNDITPSIISESRIQELKIKSANDQKYKLAFYQLEKELQSLPFRTTQDLINVSKLVSKIKDDFNSTTLNGSIFLIITVFSSFDNELTPSSLPYLNDNIAVTIIKMNNDEIVIDTYFKNIFLKINSFLLYL